MISGIGDWGLGQGMESDGEMVMVVFGWKQVTGGVELFFIRLTEWRRREVYVLIKRLRVRGLGFGCNLGQGGLY